MDCKRYKENLAAAALGALEPRREAEFSAHLAACAACRAALDDERRLLHIIDRGVAASVAAEPSAEFVTRVRRRLDQEPLPTHSWFVGWVPAAAGALAVLVLAALWLARRPPVLPGTAEPPRSAEGRQRPSREEPSPAGKTPGGARSALPVEQAATPRGQGSAIHLKRQVGARTARPEVLVPPGQRAAVLQFYEAVGSGRVDTALLLVPPPPLKPPKLEIAPLEMAKIDLDSDRKE